MPIDRTGPLDNTHSAETYTKLTKANSDISGGPVRGLWVGTPGTANLMDFDGTVVTDFPLKEGLNPIIVRQLRAGGSADDPSDRASA